MAFERHLPPPPPKNDNPLDPRNLLPFTKELVYEEGHKSVDGFRVANEPYRKATRKAQHGEEQ